MGTKGYLEIKNVNNWERIDVYDSNREFVNSYSVPEQINGYEYEVLACKKATEDGRIECQEMPHSEILRVMQIMDKAREIWGMKFPCE